MQYLYDDGSAIGQDASGEVYSREIGSTAWVNDAVPAEANWSIFSVDNQEQARMGAAYPVNGQSWDSNASMLGISRIIDTAARTYATVKGSTAATYAGQNGRTYVNGQPPGGGGGGGGLMPLLLIGAAVLLMA